MSMMLCLKPRVRGTSESLSSAWVGLQKRVFTGVITLFILGAICTAPKASQRARSARKSGRGKASAFPVAPQGTDPHGVWV